MKRYSMSPSAWFGHWRMLGEQVTEWLAGNPEHHCGGVIHTD